MGTTLVEHLALVSETGRVDLAEVAVVAAALQKQVTRDLVQSWNISATVSAFARLEDVPIGYWPMIIMDDIGFDAAGIHLDEDGQPFALISSSNDNDVWSLTASHECLEMLVDPFGDRLVAGDSPKLDQGRVLFLVEVCDPSEAAEFGYTVNGVMVSDFYTPRFFDPVVATGVRYSFTDAISGPREVLRGGYLSWKDLTTDDWWQEIWFDGNQSRFRNLGPLSIADGSYRSQIDRITAAETFGAIEPARSVAAAAGLAVPMIQASSVAKAESLRRQISEILGESSEEPSESVPNLDRGRVRRVRRDARRNEMRDSYDEQQRRSPKAPRRTSARSD